MVAVIVTADQVSQRTGVPGAVLLTVAGLVYAVLPGPNLRLRPDLVLDVVIPPLLYHAALGSSLLALRSRLRPVVSLSVVLVLVTALVTGGMLTWLVPAVPLAAAVSLATPFAAYAAASAAHVSGVLAVAVAGLIIGHHTPGCRPSRLERSYARTFHSFCDTVKL